MASKIFSTATLLVLSFACFGSNAATSWKFTESVDDMTDKKECRLDGPNQNVLMSFQGDSLYFVSGSPITVERTHLITLRVDKNPAQEITLRVINPNLVTAGNAEELTTLLSQFSSGTSFKLRLLTLSGIEEDAGSLSGFNAAYAKFKLCRATARG